MAEIDSLVELLKGAMSDGGADAVVAAILGLPEPDRLKAFSAAQQLFGPRGASFAGLDAVVTIVRAGIDEALRRSAAEPDVARAAQLLDTANIFSFNLSADLADCWPGDDVPRETAHFHEGLRAADDCIRWRDELGKPDDRRSMAWWARGAHLLRLGHIDDAVDAFRRAAALVGVDAGGQVTALNAFDQILYHGYECLARHARGDAGAHETYAAALAAFEAQFEDENLQEDARFGRDQLVVMQNRLMVGGM